VYKLATDRFLHTDTTSFLGVGCGPGRKLTEMLGPKLGQMTLYLIDQPNVRPFLSKQLPEAAQFRAVNLEHRGLDLGLRFDMILCADVVEHLDDPGPCLDLIRRHLADRGLAFISTPDRDYRRGRHCTSSPNPFHVREWNSAEFRRFLESAGLEPIEHYRLPNSRLSPLEYWLSRAVHRWVRNRRWSACQTWVCTRRTPVGDQGVG
jgi:SAM-dependent methyltransferase